jgi:predicted nucleic acid-binding protein
VVARLTRRERRRRATCLLTQAAFARLSSNPAVIPGAKSPAEAGEMLGRLIDHPDHVFLEARSKQLARLQGSLARCHGHNQVNDAFLIWLASSHGARVVTFDAALRHLPPKPELVELVA